MINDLLSIARQAGEVILSHYHTPVDVETKSDSSPLTIADRSSHELISYRLAHLTPEIPIISEESSLPSPEERKDWTTYWLVDPLDGTKEFLKKTGEFTVNIGLIRDGIPILGVVHAPVTGLTFWTDGKTAWKEEKDHPPVEIQAREYTGGQPTFVASRDHAGPEVKALLERYPEAAFRSMGSSLKFCLVAAGAADMYLRDVPTMEWDTAASHAILLAAGASLQCLNGEPLTYNKAELRNPGIVALRPGAEKLLG